MPIDFAKLREPFPVADVSWRIGQAGKSGDKVWAKVLAYLDNRAIMDRLDNVVGPDNWKNEYAPGPAGGVICGISIKVDGEWVTKWDGADNTDIEATKGGLSDAMKRAAVQWGIGRYLYELGENFAETSTDRKPGWHFAKSKEAGNFYWSPPKGVLPGGEQAKPAAKQTKQLANEHQAETGEELARRQAAEDAQIADILGQIATHTGYPKALQNLYDTVITQAYQGGSGRLRGLIKEKVKPAFEKVMPKEPAAA